MFAVCAEPTGEVDLIMKECNLKYKVPGSHRGHTDLGEGLYITHFGEYPLVSYMYMS